MGAVPTPYPSTHRMGRVKGEIMKRIFDLNGSDLESLDKAALLGLIRTSEGRTVVAETLVMSQPLTDGVSNPELAGAFGADLILLNRFHCERPFVFGLDDGNATLSSLEDYASHIARQTLLNRQNPDYIRSLRRLIGRPLGLNLEPVPPGSDGPSGHALNQSNLEYIRDQGFDCLVITGNPGTGVTERQILEGIRQARSILGEQMVIVAGKMHCAGTDSVLTDTFVESYLEAGADILLLPAPGTVPGFTFSVVTDLIRLIHQRGGLAMAGIGTSQEGAGPQVIEQIALMSKMAGADLQHIGDAGPGGMAPPENIMALSLAIRGRRHTYRRMGASILR